jgi:hypothetical protein
MRPLYDSYSVPRLESQRSKISMQDEVLTLFAAICCKLLCMRPLYLESRYRVNRDAGTTGAAGASAPLAFCIFNFVGAVRVQTMGVSGLTKLLQQTELNVARGCVWGCSTPQSSGIRQSCYPFGER